MIATAITGRFACESGFWLNFLYLPGLSQVGKFRRCPPGMLQSICSIHFLASAGSEVSDTRHAALLGNVIRR